MPAPHTSPDANPAAVPHDRRRHTTLIIAAVAVLVIDIASKVASSEWLAGRGVVELPGPLDLRLGYNPGVAFGLGDTLPAWLVFVLTSAVATAIAVTAWRGFFASSLAAGVVVGGAIANVADRAQGGTVVDMLYTGWWPTFNVADVAVVCGGIALAVTGWRAAANETDPE
jgi:signal peptidase II